MTPQRAHFALEPQCPLNQEGFRTLAKDIGIPELTGKKRRWIDASSNATSWADNSGKY